ncbi:MAG: alpha/beta hydrolase [Gammaproteobacteria bacterium]|nr:alpha/beta hydrolase [Gammaproteobacteria bacterium]
MNHNPEEIIRLRGIKSERTGVLAVSKRQIEYARYPASKVGLPVIVLLHEGLGCVSMWRDFPERLAAQTGAEVFAYSRPGYGGSSPVELPRPVEYMHVEALEVLPWVLDAADIGECLLVGHSDGGSIALISAVDALKSHMRGLVLLAAHVFNEAITVANIEAATAAYASTYMKEKLARHHGDNVDVAFSGWSGVWLSPGFRDWNIESCLSRITTPMLVIQGEDDIYGTLAQVDAIRGGVAARIETEVWPACGHSPHREVPERLLARIDIFLQALDQVV